MQENVRNAIRIYSLTKFGRMENWLKNIQNVRMKNVFLMNNLLKGAINGLS